MVSISFLMVVLCRGVYYSKIIIFANNEECRWIVIFQFYSLEPQITEHTLFYKNIISTNIETETERVFSCYLRNPCSLSKYKYWKSKSKSEITTLIYHYWSYYIRYYETL